MADLKPRSDSTLQRRVGLAKVLYGNYESLCGERVEIGVDVFRWIVQSRAVGAGHRDDLALVQVHLLGNKRVRIDRLDPETGREQTG